MTRIEEILDMFHELRKTHTYVSARLIGDEMRLTVEAVHSCIRHQQLRAVRHKRNDLYVEVDHQSAENRMKAIRYLRAENSQGRHPRIKEIAAGAGVSIMIFKAMHDNGLLVARGTGPILQWEAPMDIVPVKNPTSDYMRANPLPQTKGINRKELNRQRAKEERQQRQASRRVIVSDRAIDFLKSSLRGNATPKLKATTEQRARNHPEPAENQERDNFAFAVYHAACHNPASARAIASRTGYELDRVEKELHRLTKPPGKYERPLLKCVDGIYSQSLVAMGTKDIPSGIRIFPGSALLQKREW